ncbi:hypothetical protein [Azospirillum sp.]|uniref:hypothetical protein n=1 Tax=Azospirillum sp. TaxID=34012 RepID=UPI002628B6C9|nr:hypothetical protein [Azospirillum sp.]
MFAIISKDRKPPRRRPPRKPSDDCRGIHPPHGGFRGDSGAKYFARMAAALTEPLPPAPELSYRSGQTPIIPPSDQRERLMDIAIMVLAVVFFFWQTISE